MPCPQERSWRMHTRKTILVYQYSERIKSELIIASELSTKMATLAGAELSGAKKLMRLFLQALVGEIRIAQGIESSVNFVGAEKKVMEALGRMELFEHSEVRRCLSEALSLITTSCQRSIEVLMDRGLM